MQKLNKNKFGGLRSCNSEDRFIQLWHAILKGLCLFKLDILTSNERFVLMFRKAWTQKIYSHTTCHCYYLFCGLHGFQKMVNSQCHLKSNNNNKKRVSNGFSLNFWSTSHFFLAKLYRQGTKGSQCEASIGWSFKCSGCVWAANDSMTSMGSWKEIIPIMCDLLTTSLCI